MSYVKFTLGIESSCDETAAAVYGGNPPVFFEKVARQFDIHSPYGGVVPELASRCHLEAVSLLVTETCKEANIKLDDISLVAATAGPGLAGALVVGLTYGKSLAFALKKPFVAVNHVEAHMYAACAESEIDLPFIALVVSGGHTLLVDVKDELEYTILGRTHDDAAGEAFDKGAKILGLPYPGGVSIEKTGKSGNVSAYDFPRALKERKSLDFSFSGLKTSLLYFNEKNPDAPIEDVCASYQQAIVDVLVRKSIFAAQRLNRKTIVLGGGVVANKKLREDMTSAANKKGIRVVLPSFNLCTDNARMIAYRGKILYEKRGADDLKTDIFPMFVKKCNQGLCP